VLGICPRDLSSLTLLIGLSSCTGFSHYCDPNFANQTHRLIAVVGALFTKIPPNRRPFSPVDANISFPYKLHETISTGTLVLVSLVAPGIIIFLVCLLFVPGPTLGGKSAPKSLIWRRKFWEWNTGWMGLGLALASAFLLTDGMKNLFGKPRPDLLSRCNPDLKNIQNYAVGGYGDQITEGILLVSWHICRQTDMSILNDGFASFPSGHSSCKSSPTFNLRVRTNIYQFLGQA